MGESELERQSCTSLGIWCWVWWGWCGSTGVLSWFSFAFYLGGHRIKTVRWSPPVAWGFGILLLHFYLFSPKHKLTQKLVLVLTFAFIYFLSKFFGEMKLLITGSSTLAVVHELPLSMKDSLFTVGFHVTNWWKSESLHISCLQKSLEMLGDL